MKNNIKCLLLIAFFFISYTFCSCEKIIEIQPSTSQVLGSEVYGDSTLVKPVLAAIYGRLAFSIAYGSNISILGGYSADELQNVYSTTYDPFIKNALLSNDSDVADLWSSTYAVIYIANSVIEGVPNGSGLTDGFKNKAIAEAKFIRAFCYFYLINLYGDVPLILGTDVNPNAIASRTPISTIYQQIITDLQFAQDNLPANYSLSSGQRTRANKWAASALLSRVYLYIGDWANAETQATAVIANTALFSLPADLTKVFTPTSQEAILQFYNDATGYTAIARTIIPSPVNPIPKVVYTTQFVSYFESDDKRKTTWTATINYNGTTYTYPYKYKNITNGANAEYNTVFRLAEQYLIRAEARINQSGKVAAGIADMNVIRERARPAPTIQIPNPLPALSLSLSKADALLAVEAERRIELSCEWGHRWFDLKRTNRVNTVIGALKSTWKPSATLYPIPLAEVLANPNLKQNPGYN